MANYRPITDVWLLARPKIKYWGAYPNGFLERAKVLLGVHRCDPVLHVCGGRARQYPAWAKLCPMDRTLDLDAALNPDYVQDARELLPLRSGHEMGVNAETLFPWPALIADPPYTKADAMHYAPGKAVFPSANVVLRRMLAAVRIGGRVGILHYVLPQPPREGVKFIACIGVIVGYNNRIRVFSVYERIA